MKLAIIVGSIREGRMTDRLAKWVQKQAKTLPNTEIEMLDLKDYPMPLFDEAISPRYNPDRNSRPEVKKWLDKVAEFDGYVIVTPEYNRSTSAVVKNAIDYLDYQMEQKPVALVAHGSSGGAQAVGHLRGILPGVGAVTVPQALYFTHRVRETVDENGELSKELKASPHGPQANIETQLKSLIWYAEALAAARAKQ